MNRAELVYRLARKQPYLHESDAHLAVKIMIDQMSGTLACGGRIEIRGFGSFSLRHREPRTARNPRTGRQIALGKRYVPFFRAGKELRERVNIGRGAVLLNDAVTGRLEELADDS